MSHRYNKKQLANQNKGTSEENKENLTKLEKADQQGDKIILFVKSGVIKIFCGIILIITGLVSIIGLIEAYNNKPEDGVGLFGFSSFIVVGLLGGTALIIWYYMTNVKKKVLKKTKEDLATINQKNSEKAVIKQKSQVEIAKEKEKNK